MISACPMKSTRVTGMKAPGTKAAAMKIGGSSARPGPTKGTGMHSAATRQIMNRYGNPKIRPTTIVRVTWMAMRITWDQSHPLKARPTDRSKRSSWVSKRFGITLRHLACRPSASETMKTDRIRIIERVPTTEATVPAMAPD